ncbi:hypothetical protein [Massilia horti]|uniref:Secreted protein n=1 Tax=Massilia horti TaxID=2562153 RepID=A0A4Y9T3U7_9BURK|nr:hypothetical protein [Massilia horti]TFW34919.1 hypothetical protein E4O92_02880 [Massilia horti]
MRLFIAALLTLTAGSTAFAGVTQQQCESLSKPVYEKFPAVQTRDDEVTLSPQKCALVKDLIKVYEDYVAKADKMSCPFAYNEGKKVGGAAERADMLAGLRKVYKENCR